MLPCSIRMAGSGDLPKVNMHFAQGMGTVKTASGTDGAAVRSLPHIRALREAPVASGAEGCGGGDVWESMGQSKNPNHILLSPGDFRYIFAPSSAALTACCG